MFFLQKLEKNGNKLPKISIFMLIFFFSIDFAYSEDSSLKISKETEISAKFQDWSVVRTNRGDREICYLISVPIKTSSSFGKRGEPFFLVTNIPNDADEISASSGFIYNQNSDVEISFGSKRFYLFPYESRAWAQNKNDDIDIIKEMQKHDEITVMGVADNRKIANDFYSLIGFNQAYEKMKQICKGL